MKPNVFAYDQRQTTTNEIAVDGDPDETSQTMAKPIVDGKDPDEAKIEFIIKMFMQKAKTYRALDGSG